ncbi:MAG: pilus assembly protein TadG-related protein [Actinomycetota bacterium]
MSAPGNGMSAPDDGMSAPDDGMSAPDDGMTVATNDSAPAHGVRDPHNGVRAAVADERGATLALVALSLVWMVGIVALVVDLGDGWLSRQSLIPATDAAALAAAQDLVADPSNSSGACVTARTYVSANAATATMTDCHVTTNGGGGQVTVSASDQLTPSFAGVESGPSDVISSSTVRWGAPRAVSGLRPFGLCYDGSHDLQQILDNPPPYQVWVRITYTKDDPSDCGGPAALGNFATIDFDGNSSVDVIRDWMLNGYPNHLGFDPPSVTDCSGNAVCYDRPYASSDIRDEITALKNSETFVSFPVFNYADEDSVHLVGLLRARFYKFQLDGPPEDWWIELKIRPGLVAGTCCGPPTLRTGTKTIAICAVDHDATGGACAAGGS